MSISPINSYKDFCAEFIPEQYKNSEKLLGLIELALAQCDFIEKALHELLDSIDISKAEGPALDFIGALVGVERVPGQTDSAYRVRILRGNDSAGLPAPEVLRRILRLIFEQDEIGLYPCWPAGIYFVLYEYSEQLLPSNISDYCPSGVDIAQGTFLCLEDGEEYGLLILEDNENPIICDSVPLAFDYFYFVDENNDYLLFDEETPIVGYERI